MSWKPECQVGDGKWYDNSIRFETEREAALNANDLARRWSAVRAVRATLSTDPANYRWDEAKGRLVALTAEVAPGLAAKLREQGLIK